MTTNIGGHEGIGRIVKLGTGVSEDFIGKRVGIKWIYSSCGTCEICSVNPTACSNQRNPGRDVPGSFQQYVVSPIQHLTKIPEQLSPSTVAPLLCAGLTMYSAIAKAGLKTGDWLVLPGAGGGLGHLGIQIAAKQGYRTIAVDAGSEKRRLCLELGATAFFDYTIDDVEASVKALTSGYGAHAAICTASSFGAYKQSLEMLRNLGTLVCIGLAVDDLPISPLDMIIRGVRVIGSSVGTEAEMQDLLSMALSGDVKPSVESFNFEDIDMVLQKLAKYQIAGRAVFQIPP